MAEHKVQLKEQEIVGQEVVLSDIYPKRIRLLWKMSPQAFRWM